MKALNILTIACAGMMSFAAAPLAEARDHHRSYRYYSRPYSRSYYRPHYAYYRPAYYSRPYNYGYSRPYYYYRPTTVVYSDPYYYDDYYYPRYYSCPSIGFIFAFGGHHWRHHHH